MRRMDFPILPSHWLLEDDHEVFRNAISKMVITAAEDLCRVDVRSTLGDEHDQCQHLFTKLFTIMQQNTDELTEALLCCSKVPDPVLMLGYYRSRIRRSRTSADPQFIESETGADFALTLEVDLPNVLRANRSVLGQAKIIGPKPISIKKDQLRMILKVAGPESGAYLVWDEDTTPTIISAANIATHCRLHDKDLIDTSLLPVGKPLAEFLCDVFLALWFGRDYDPVLEGDKVPSGSIGVLYHFLHSAVPPPNVLYMGVASAKKHQTKPGVVVIPPKELE